MSWLILIGEMTLFVDWNFTIFTITTEGYYVMEVSSINNIVLDNNYSTINLHGDCRLLFAILNESDRILWALLESLNGCIFAIILFNVNN